MFLVHFFTQFIYQPFFNILIFLYWLMDITPGLEPDMGIAVIFLTLVIRVLMLPLSLAGRRSEKDRRDIAEQIRGIEATHEAEPIVRDQKKKSALKKNRGVFIAELINLVIQVSIALMLWRIFARGLEGADFHLIYSIMPEVSTPFNLMFLGKFDLSHTNIWMNLFQSFSIFVLETVQILTSPFHHNRHEVVRYQLVLPVVSFLVFMGLPAGKKLFVITTLWFSVVLQIVLFIRRKFLEYGEKQAAKEAADQAPVEAIVQEV